MGTVVWTVRREPADQMGWCGWDITVDASGRANREGARAKGKTGGHHPRCEVGQPNRRDIDDYQEKKEEGDIGLD